MNCIGQTVILRRLLFSQGFVRFTQMVGCKDQY